MSKCDVCKAKMVTIDYPQVNTIVLRRLTHCSKHAHHTFAEGSPSLATLDFEMIKHMQKKESEELAGGV